METVHTGEGCGRSTRVETIDGVECVVARDGFGRVKALSCP